MANVLQELRKEYDINSDKYYESTTMVKMRVWILFVVLPWAES